MIGLGSSGISYRIRDFYSNKMGSLERLIEARVSQPFSSRFPRPSVFSALDHAHARTSNLLLHQAGRYAPLPGKKSKSSVAKQTLPSGKRTDESVTLSFFLFSFLSTFLVWNFKQLPCNSIDFWPIFNLISTIFNDSFEYLLPDF